MIEPVFQRMVEVIAEVEPVHVLGGPPDVFKRATEKLSHVSNAIVHPIATNDVWIRDYGPTFVHDRQLQTLVAVDWTYNAWGGKWPPWDEDARNALRIAELERVSASSVNLICEGGALETDGQGTLLTTSSCLMSNSRNPNWTRDQVEAVLINQLGVKKVLWVDGGALAGDDTDSHIDQLVRFSQPGRVLAAISSSSEDENHPKLLAQYQNLKLLTDAKDNHLDIVELPTPPPRYISTKRVPESYCNFYLANSIVVVPTFGFRKTDEPAIQIIKNEFPDRQIVTIDCSDMIWGLGAIHCATQQQPMPPV
jgi:agmatine deiminase